MLESFAVYGALSLFSTAVNQFLNKSRQNEQLAVQKEAERLREEAAEARQAGQHKHAEKMFALARKKELELQRIQFENQKTLADHAANNARDNIDEAEAIRNFPLTLTPRQVLKSPETLTVITNHGALPKLDGPPGGDGSGYRGRTAELDHNLRQFLQNGYGPSSPTHPTLFLNGSWRDPGRTGNTAVTALYSFLRARATLYFEYHTVGKEIFVEVAHWWPGAASFESFTFARFKYDAADGETVMRRLSALQALAAGATADMRALMGSQAAPMLPHRLAEIAGADGDEVVQRGVGLVLGAYLSALRHLSETMPERAAELALGIAEGLLDLPDAPSAERFLAASLGLFIEARGSRPRAAGDKSDLLNQAVSLGLSLDKPYLERARGLRRRLLEIGIDPVIAPRALPEPAGELDAPPSFAARLEQTRAALREIKGRVEAVCRLSPEDLNDYLTGEGADGADGAVGFTTDELLAALDGALEGLKTPTFRMVPVGVTNAGKSTLIGSIIGRDLLPRGSGEVSRGVLRFIHAPGELSVCEVWPPEGEGGGENYEPVELAAGLDNPDERIAAYLKQKMIEYTEHGLKEGRRFPRIEIRSPLLPGAWRGMFELPPEVAFEVADVPGLNSTNNDDRNLAIIQNEVQGSFCLFVLDWNTTSEERDEMLLATVKEMLEATSADRESVIFVLNKFDMRTRDDSAEDIERRVNSFRATLQRGLGLREEPEIILMSSLTWFYGQVGWGPASLSDGPITPAPVRAQMLDGLVSDSGTIRKLARTDARRFWFSQKIEYGALEEVSDEDMRYLLTEIIYPESGAARLRERIADRVRRRCASLVIRPVVNEAWRMTETFMARVRQRFKHAKITDAEQITGEVERINRCAAELRSAIETEAKSFAEAAATSVRLVYTLGSAADWAPGAAFKRPADRKKVEGFHHWMLDKGVDVKEFTAIVPELSKELQNKLARPLRGFKAGQGLPDTWREILKRQRAEALHAAATEYFTLLKAYTAAGSDLKVQYAVRDSDAAGLKRIDAAVKAYNRLLEQLKLAMTERCDYVLQMKLAKMLENAQKLLDSFYSSIADKARVIVGDVDLTAAILAGKQPPPLYDKRVSQSFAPKPAGEIKTESRTVIEKETAVIRTAARSAGDSFRWFKRKLFGESTEDLFQTVTKDVERERDHRVSYLPSGEGLQEQANKSLEEKTQEMSRNLAAWLEGLLNSYAEVLSSASEQVSASMTAALEEQLQRTAAEHRRGRKEWDKIGADLAGGAESLRMLEQAVADGAAPAR